MLAGGCARDNPLFGLGAGRTGGGSMGDDDDDGAIVTSGGPMLTGSGGGSGGSTGDGMTGPVVGSTGVGDDGTTSLPGGTTVAETEDSSASTGGDPKDIVLFLGPSVPGNFCFEAPPTDTYGCAVDACVGHASSVGAPCGNGAMIFAILRAEPYLVIELDAFPAAVVGRQVVGEAGDVIAETIDLLLAGTLVTSLQDASVVDGPFWTGGYDNGAGANADCSDWSSESGSGWAGDPTVTNATWFEAQDLECDEPLPIICACAE